MPCPGSRRGRQFPPPPADTACRVPTRSPPAGLSRSSRSYWYSSTVSHRLDKTWTQRLARAGAVRPRPDQAAPLPRHGAGGVGEPRQPRLRLEGAERGVCDGCALGVAGLHDWTIDGVHLCMTRLNLLRLNTMPALDVRRLADVERAAPAAQRRAARARPAAGSAAARARRPRLPAHHLGRGLRAHRRAHPRQRAAPHRLLPDRARRHQRDVLRRAEGRALPRHQQHRQRRAPLPLALDRRDEARRSASPPRTCSYRDWCGTDLIIFFGSNPANDQPVTMKYLHEAKRLGTKVVLVNPLPRAGHGALLGAVDAAQRAVRHRHRRLLVRRRAGRRHRLPLRRDQDPARAAAGYDQAFVDAHTDGLRRAGGRRGALRRGRSSSARPACRAPAWRSSPR